MSSWVKRKLSHSAQDHAQPTQIEGTTTGKSEPKAEPAEISAEETSRQDLEQPSFILLISRVDPKTVELRNAATSELVYTIRDTGRKMMSSKPDHELYRMSGGEQLVGQLRMGSIKDEVKFPLTGKKIDGIEKVTSGSQGKLKWETTRIGKRLLRSDGPNRAEADVGAAAAAVREKATLLPWIGEAECVHDSKEMRQREGPICAIRIVDPTPNGRLEIWDRYACVDAGGDWELLDEYVAVGYANLERVRREVAALPNARQLVGYTLSAMSGPGF